MLRRERERVNMLTALGQDRVSANPAGLRNNGNILASDAVTSISMRLFPSLSFDCFCTCFDILCSRMRADRQQERRG